MKLTQLRYICEVAKSGLSISAVAEQLHATQPGVSTQIRQLEDELGVRIFERSGKRLSGITEPGQVILELAQRILGDVDNIQRVGQQFTDEKRGALTIATTHTQARYALPPVVKQFSTRYPNVTLHIHQGDPTHCANEVLAGRADFAIATESLHGNPELVVLPCYHWNRSVVVPDGHPLLDEPVLTLEALVRYPIITYDFAFTGRSVINKAFEERGLEPNVVLTAIDADVIKTYVELGLGVGVLAKMAYNPERDINLKAIDASHLFEESVTNISIQRRKYLRGYMYDFIEMFSSGLTRKSVLEAMGQSRS